jgi:hypothetical protein
LHKCPGCGSAASIWDSSWIERRFKTVRFAASSLPRRLAGADAGSPMARQLAPGSCVRQILQKEVWLWAGNKWDVL